MDLERLIADVESQMIAAERRERTQLIDEAVEAELATTSLEMRIRAALGRELKVTLAGGQAMEGRVEECGQGWFSLISERSNYLLQVQKVACLVGLSGSRNADVCNFKFSVALRRLQGGRVRLLCGSQNWSGRLLTVGADWLQLKQEGSGALLVVPLGQIEALAY